MHSTGSDGRLTPEEVVKEAIATGIHFMCFTDHYRRPKEVKAGWDTSGFHPSKYLQEVRDLQKKYKNQIDISFGAEFDWLPNNIDWIKHEIANEHYDFLIGSVHLVFRKNEIFNFMFSAGHGKNWLDSANRFGGTKEFVKAYYSQMRSMIKSDLFDSIGHFDVIKMHNKDSSFFSEDEPWYQTEVITTLDLLQKSKMAMEINTSGLTRDVAVQYPSLWILKEARKRNIPITIGTDAHSKEKISQELNFAYDLAKEAGYSEIVRFKDRKMIVIPLA